MLEKRWKKTRSEIIYENRWMKFIRDEVIHPNGKKGEYTYLDAIPGVIVIPVQDDHIYMIKEFKYPINNWIWNLFTGGIKKGENPLDVAKNELMSEGAITASEWKYLGKFYFAPGIETTYNHIYLATSLTINKFKENGEGDELISVRSKFSNDEIKDMIKNDEIDSGLVIAALQKYFIYDARNRSKKS